MSEGKIYTKPHLRPSAADIVTADSFENFLSRTGIGTDNLNSASHYGFSPISRNRTQLEWVYRSSWLAGMAVDAIAEDMTREGVEIHTEDEPEKVDALKKEAERLQIWPKLGETVKWARLYGGACGFLMIDGQDSTTPLKLETIGKGQFKGVLPLDRWMLQPSLTDLVTDMGPDFGLPKFYDLLPDASGMPYMRIHYTRMVRLTGVTLPYWQRIGEMLWGQSVLERLWDRLVPFDSTTQGAAQLVYKAHLRVVRVKKLREIIALGGKALDGLLKQFDMIRKFQSNEGITLLDQDDEFDTHQYTFSGLSDVLLQQAQQISGAIETPLVRLFGQSPAGLNSTGDSDWQNYYDGIKKKQESQLRPGVEKIYHALYRSTHGSAPPKSFTIKFASLWQMDEVERANVVNLITAAIISAYQALVIDRPTALMELRQLAALTGVWSNISNDLIEEAKNEAPPEPGEPGTDAAGKASAANPRSPAEEDGPGADGDRKSRKDLREAA